MDIERIEQILNAKADDRIALIKSLQSEIWGLDEDSSVEEADLLADLAYDLDFYEPDSARRTESASFYGDDRLHDLLESAQTKLRELQRRPPNTD